MARPTIYFVRHGQTDWNAERRLQGQLDIPLNAKGRSQAKRNGGVLAELLEDPERFQFVASPSVRARETIEIVRTQLGLAPKAYQTDPRLMEVSFGDWQGRTWDELIGADGAAVDARMAAPWTYRPPNGESYADLYGRVVAWLEGVDSDSVVVSHGGVCRCLIAHFEGIDELATPLLKVRQDRLVMIKGEEISWI